MGKMESKGMEVRNIQDIINELHRHPDCISVDVFTLSDAVEFLNERIEDEYGHEITDTDSLLISVDDLTDADVKSIKNHVNNNLSGLWHGWDGSMYPELYELEDLNKKIRRQSKLLDILN